MGVKITRHDIGAEIISILTKGMYTDPRDALREYVQNGIDANAQNIEIKIRGNSIVIEDDGIGMDEETMKKAIRIGISDKNPNVDVGFRGIGIYSSFHLCDNLHIYSKSENDNNPYLLTFDFKKMKEILHQQQMERLKDQLTGEQLIDLQSLLEKHIEFTILDESKFPKVGTRVEMINLDLNFFKSLTKFEEVADYLRQVVPLHFHPEKFKWSKEIESKIYEICKEHKAEFKLVNLILQVNTKIETLYRPYTDERFHNNVPIEPYFFEVKNNGYFFGVAWGCLNSKREKINDKELRGFLIKKQGFAIGKRINIATYFGRTTYFDRYIGEIIVVCSELLPNAARTDFEFSHLRILFYEALRKVAYKYNKEADEYQEFTKGDEQLDEAIKRLKKHEAIISFCTDNTEQLVDIIVDVLKIRDQIYGRLKREVIRPERIEEAKNVLKSAEALQKVIQGFISKAGKGIKVSPKGKTTEIKSIERIKKLPEIQPEEFPEKYPESLVEIFNIFELPASGPLKAILELIDERFIQASANNKQEYLLILKNLKDEIEDLLIEE
jgi:hypothetical protein